VCGTNVAPCTTGKTKCVIDEDPTNADTTEPGFVCVGNTVGSAEICDGMDQDCDTKIDEDIDPGVDGRLGERCGDAEVGDCRVDVDMDNVPNDPDDQPCGQCRFGLTSCVAGAVDCINLITPDDYEACNNTDDDCDGTTDECVDPDAPGCIGEVDPMSPIGDACGQDDPNACGSGELRCTDGSLECENVPTGTAELCNGMDEDCDTLIDEDFEVGDTCGTSAGECQPGILICDPEGSAERSVRTRSARPRGVRWPRQRLRQRDRRKHEQRRGVRQRRRRVQQGHSRVRLGPRALCRRRRADDGGLRLPRQRLRRQHRRRVERLAAVRRHRRMRDVPVRVAVRGCSRVRHRLPQGKSPVENDDGCFCVGSLCEREECATMTKVDENDNDAVLCAPTAIERASASAATTSARISVRACSARAASSAT